MDFKDEYFIIHFEKIYQGLTFIGYNAYKQ